MKQSGLCQLLIALLAYSHEILLGDPAFQMLVQTLVVADTQPRYWNSPLLGRVVVSGPDPYVVRTAEQFLRRVEEIIR